MNKNFLIAGIVLLLVGAGCVPPEEATPQEEENQMSLIERNKECDLYLSFAITNYQNRDYEGAVRNFKNVIDLGCSKRNTKEIYPWLSRSYVELSKLDSAYWAIRQGIKYQEDDVEMLELAAWVAGKLEITDDQIYYVQEILDLDPGNTKVLDDLVELLNQQGDYKEMLAILKIWLKIDPDNKKAMGELRHAYEMLGMDPVEIDKERCEKDPSNSQFCMAYAKALESRGEYMELPSLLNNILSYNSDNQDAMEMLAKAYLQMDNDDKAIKTYENLFNLNRSYQVAIEISKIFLDKGDYSNALDWAETAIKVSNGKGAAYYARGEVYLEAGSSCSSGNGLSFSDKLVYEMAYEDYSKAIEKKYFQARARKEALEELITTSADWFMRPEGQTEARPEGACYSWIKRTVRKK